MGEQSRSPAASPVVASTSRELRALFEGSELLAGLARPLGGVDGVLGAIEDRWLEVDGRAVHLELHRAPTDQPRAVVVFQPGSGSYARFYAIAGARFAAEGYHWLGIDRPGHGFSPGESGDCTIEEALAVSARAIAWARDEFSCPVVLMGSSLGGLIAGFAVAAGLQPDLAIAHNFIWPGKLISFRWRARWIRRFRTRPYPLRQLVNGFKGITVDPVLTAYLAAELDPQAAWTLTPRSVASLFGYHVRPAGRRVPLVVVSGDRDATIPGWASRLFLRFSGIPRTDFLSVPGAGHMLFHDYLDATLDVLRPALAEVG